ncbi:hypothetical protein ROLI_029420 [Roseobacter fucihabitans]|uniref:Uncharacterized protein n=1 Tax=Roseobacter fucihabitans TaxID=1537242 RepID=A0ABZ2BV94_9RHOB|nr:VPEID-CTERM sorting domain-containing protein [Roseobacter litoralis]MBC6965314.1 hypothetical protein [Roseobacter litoralis]
MKTVLFSASALIAMAGMAMANGNPGDFGGQATPVPEISALEGTAALAAVAAVVLIAWERRRRAA